MNTKAVIFDIDGLLVDSETVAIEVAIEICGSIGIELSPTEQQQIVGVTATKFFSDLFKERGESKYDLNDTVKKFHEVYENVLRTNIRPFIGAMSVPEHIKSQGLLMAVVSGSTERQVNIILDFLNIKELFDQIICAEDITESKPNPEGYLLAAEKLEVSPKDCIVLEDATAGVKAGKDAGMKVIGVRNNGDQDLSLADEVVDNLMEVQI